MGSFEVQGGRELVVTLLKYFSALSRSWPTGEAGCQFCKVETIESNLEKRVAAVLNASNFLQGKSSNLARTCTKKIFKPTS